MKAQRLANLTSQMLNEAASWAGSMDREDADERRVLCEELKRAVRNVILNAPPHVVANATRRLAERIGEV